MHTATYYIDLLLSGITVGSLYALIAIGYTMVYGILRLINFAHGDIFMMSGFFMIYVSATLPMAVSIPVVLLMTVLLGVLIERAAYKPLRSAPRMSVMISAIGVRNVVENRVDFTNSRNLIIAAVILVSALGFNSVGGLTFAVAGVSINLSGLAIAAIVGILLNAILPGNDYEFDSADGADAPSSGNLQV